MALVMCAVGQVETQAVLICTASCRKTHHTGPAGAGSQSVIFTFSRSAVMMVINCSRRTAIKLQIQQSGVRLLIAENGWKFISFSPFSGGSICNFRAVFS